MDWRFLAHSVVLDQGAGPISGLKLLRGGGGDGAGRSDEKEGDGSNLHFAEV